jgi:hypothetical protein
MTAADRLAFDLFLVKTKDPLAYEAGTTESRFRRRVMAMVALERQRLAGRATNPKRHHNPPRNASAIGGARLIYPSGRIKGVWEGRHKNGKLYRHRFGRGLKTVYGLPDGSLVLAAHQGRLWKTFF